MSDLREALIKIADGTINGERAREIARAALASQPSGEGFHAGLAVAAQYVRQHDNLGDIAADEILKLSAPSGLKETSVGVCQQCAKPIHSTDAAIHSFHVQPSGPKETSVEPPERKPKWVHDFGACRDSRDADLCADCDLKAKLEALRDELGSMVNDARSSVVVHKAIAAPYSFVMALEGIHKRLTAILEGK